ncbi:MAG: GNAT family N-acetyltransferase, partial [Gemmatimonadetes bacterium]|nr:GNAT family N-acetyltransferase [Gemmatimonadota bacterium]
MTGTHILAAMHATRFDGRGSSEPRDLQLRDGTVHDAEAVEAVHYSSREAVYAGRTADWPPPGPDRRGRIERWRAWLADNDISGLVAEQKGEVVGFCTIRPSEDDDATDRVAEMPTLYVRPDYWHRGLGRVLCEAGLGRAQARGFRELTLWVLEMNDRARDFYQKVGFTADGATKVDELTSERLVALRYRIDLG